jgi:hypothetical protein
VIEEGAIPHSHPVLTLSTVNGGDFQLASLLHEQMHWFCAAHDADAERAYEEQLRPRYPVVPVGRPDGAEDEESTYLHLIVCWLELDALIQLRGQSVAATVAEGAAAAGLYAWVYRTVLHDFDALRTIYAQHSLQIAAQQGG